MRKELPSLAEFGEQVLYKSLSSSAGRVENLAARFLDGTFLGVEPRTGELRIGTASGVIKARSIRRKLEEERWSSTALQNLTGTPWDPTPGTAAAQGGTTAGELDEKKDPILPKEHTEPGHLARRTRLTREDFEAHGFTPGCYGCRLLREGGEKSGGHNEVCRQRMEAANSSTAGGKDRVEEGYQRLASAAMRISEREARRVGGEVSEAGAARVAAQGMADWFRGDLSEWRAWSAAGKDRKDYGEWRKVYLDEKVRLLREAGLQQARKRRDEADREAGRPVEEDPMPRGGDGRKRVHVADGGPVRTNRQGSAGGSAPGADETARGGGTNNDEDATGPSPVSKPSGDRGRKRSASRDDAERFSESRGTGVQMEATHSAARQQGSEE